MKIKVEDCRKCEKRLIKYPEVIAFCSEYNQQIIRNKPCPGCLNCPESLKPAFLKARKEARGG